MSEPGHDTGRPERDPRTATDASLATDIDPPADTDPLAAHDGEATRAFLATVPLFAHLPPHTVRELAQAARWVHLPGGAYLFRQGDAADTLALVGSGRLLVLDEDDARIGGDGPDQVIGVLGRGAWVGELALLTGARRSASIRALRDCQLLEVPAAAFHRVLEREPELGTAVARALAEQLQQAQRIPAPPESPDTIAVVPLGDGLPVAALATRLRDALGRHGPVVVVSHPPDGSWAEHLDQLETTHPWVVLVAADPTADLEWTRFCVRSADRILVLVRGGRPPAWAADLLGESRADAVFVGTTLNGARMTPTVEALAPRAHHHLPEGAGFDRAADRIARRTSGRALGVVFSGGGARGLAHAGVIERLVAADAPIDRVGGCSAGAFAAALLALGRTPTEIIAVCREELVERHPFSDFGVPRDALIKGRRAVAMLTRVFGDVCIEELSIDFFAVSADLASGELVVHRRGLVRDAVAASMSIPGFAPPVHADGRLLVDGGLLDNLPVDVMRDLDEGPIVAVDVMRRFPLPETSMPGGGGWSGHRIREVVGPGIVSTLARSMVLGGWQRAELNRRAADLLITPAVDDIGMFEFDRIDDALAAGRSAADEALRAGLPGRP